MSRARGALLVFEGCDRAGKSTQVKLLTKALNERGIPTKALSFPNRTTTIGAVINSFLTKTKDFPQETVHLLFSANRWECSPEIQQLLLDGTTLIVDRYAASGAAYTAAVTGRNLSWCQEPDRGLPQPDMVTLLDISESTQLHARGGWGEERFETEEVQQRVAQNYKNLADSSWVIVNAHQEPDKIHTKVIEKALKIIEEVKHLPIGLLYES